MKKRVKIVFKLATNGQSDKGFLLTSTFVPKGLSAPALGLCTCIKNIKIYTRCQVSVYRTTDPLVYYQNSQFVKKTIKKIRFLVIHDFIILTRHCQSFLVHKDDDRISCIYVKKLWRPISDLIIRRA